MKNMIKLSVIAALFTVSAHASAATATFSLNYSAGTAIPISNTTGLPTPAANTAYGTTPGYLGLSVGSVTFTDLSDLNLGDGKSGVRVSLNIDFSSIKTNTGSVYLAGYELNFPGTSKAGPSNSELPSTPNTSGGSASVNQGNGTTWRYVSGQDLTNVRSGGAIEFGEDGAVNGWGAAVGDPSFEQEMNYVASAYTGGNSTIDFLNGLYNYNGFTVANLLSNTVENTNSALPDALIWLKVRGTGFGINSSLIGLQQNSSTGAQTLNVLSVVPEAETYSMMMAGLALIGTIVRRRKSA